MATKFYEGKIYQIGKPDTTWCDFEHTQDHGWGETSYSEVAIADETGYYQWEDCYQMRHVQFEVVVVEDAETAMTVFPKEFEDIGDGYYEFRSGDEYIFFYTDDDGKIKDVDKYE